MVAVEASVGATIKIRNPVKVYGMAAKAGILAIGAPTGVAKIRATEHRAEAVAGAGEEMEGRAGMLVARSSTT
jgi:hypothetical protein